MPGSLHVVATLHRADEGIDPRLVAVRNHFALDGQPFSKRPASSRQDRRDVLGGSESLLRDQPSVGGGPSRTRTFARLPTLSPAKEKGHGRQRSR
jgi:hypothetical protein